MTAEARIAALETTVRRLADQLEIYQLLAAYGPAVDSGSAGATAALWADDGVYDVDVGCWTGPDEIAAMVEAPLHQRLIARGCAHVMSLPRVTIDGDTAVATNHSRLYAQGRNGVRPLRIAANRWELVRTALGWRVARRINRQLDGGEPARALFRQSF